MTIALLLFCSLQAQTITEPIISHGPVPELLLRRNKQIAAQSTQKKPVLNYRKYKKEDHSEWAENIFLDKFINSGRIVYGDSINLYLDAVAKRVLAPYSGKLNQVRVYLIKSPEILTFSTRYQDLFISTGALALAKDEASVAYLIARQGVHLMYKHYPVLYPTGKYFSNLVNPDILSQSLVLYKNEDEIFADTMGLQLTRAAGYDESSAWDGFELLNYHYEDWGQFPIADSLVRSVVFTPAMLQYKKGSIFDTTEIFGKFFHFEHSDGNVAETENNTNSGHQVRYYYSGGDDYIYRTTYYSHNLKEKNQLSAGSRIATVEEALRDTKGRQFLTASEAQFQQYQKSARRQEVLELLREKKYQAAIYNSYVNDKLYGKEDLNALVRAFAWYSMVYNLNASRKDIVKFNEETAPAGRIEMNQIFKTHTVLQLQLLAVRQIATEVRTTKTKAVMDELLDGTLTILFNNLKFFPKKYMETQVGPDSGSMNTAVFADLWDTEFKSHFKAARELRIQQTFNVSRTDPDAFDPDSKHYSGKDSIWEFIPESFGRNAAKRSLGIDTLLVGNPSLIWTHSNTDGYNDFRQLGAEPVIEMQMRNQLAKSAGETQLKVIPFHIAGFDGITTAIYNRNCAAARAMGAIANNEFEPIINIDRELAANEFNGRKNLHLCWLTYECESKNRFDSYDDAMFLTGSIICLIPLPFYLVYRSMDKYSTKQYCVVANTMNSNIEGTILMSGKSKVSASYIRSHMDNICNQVHNKP